MPLPSVRLYGARQCKAITKRSKRRCLNPAAYKCSTCRYHGATPPHTRKAVQGELHPQYKHGMLTKKSKMQDRRTRLRLWMLEQIGWHLKMFQGLKTRGRKPNEYRQLDLDDPEQMQYAILQTLV